jgi:hypothetical protein
MKKSWLVRHSFLVGTLLMVIFFGVGFALGYAVNPFYCLLILPGLILYCGELVLLEKWMWVCSKCGNKKYGNREKYCRICGEEMILKRVKILVKYCENGHRVEDSYNSAKACPKCGKPFKQEKTELK